MREKQQTTIINHLVYKGSITKLEACKLYNITKADTRISELRNKGVEIFDIWVDTDDKRKAYKRYYLDEKTRNKYKNEDISAQKEMS